MGYRVPGLAKDPTELYLQQLGRASEEQRADLRDMSQDNVKAIAGRWAAPGNWMKSGIEGYVQGSEFAEEGKRRGRAAAQEERAKGSYEQEQKLGGLRISDAETALAQRKAEEAVLAGVDSSGKSLRERSIVMDKLTAPEAQIAQAKAGTELARGQLGVSRMLAGDTMKSNALGRDLTSLGIDEQKVASARNVFANAMSNQKTQGIPYDRNAVVQTLMSTGKFTPQQIAEAERGAYVDPARVALANANLSQDTLKLADDADKYAQLIDQNKRAVGEYKKQTGGLGESEVSDRLREQIAKSMDASGLEGLSGQASMLRTSMPGKILNAIRGAGSNQPILAEDVVNRSSTALEDELIQDLESRLSKVPVEERSLPKVSKAMQTLAALKAQRGNRPKITPAPAPGGGQATIQNASLPGDRPSGVSKYRPMTEGRR